MTGHPDDEFERLFADGSATLPDVADRVVQVRHRHRVLEQRRRAALACAAIGGVTAVILAGTALDGAYSGGGRNRSTDAVVGSTASAGASSSVASRSAPAAQPSPTQAQPTAAIGSPAGSLASTGRSPSPRVTPASPPADPANTTASAAAPTAPRAAWLPTAAAACSGKQTTQITQFSDEGDGFASPQALIASLGLTGRVHPAGSSAHGQTYSQTVNGRVVRTLVLDEQAPGKWFLLQISVPGPCTP